MLKSVEKSKLRNIQLHKSIWKKKGLSVPDVQIPSFLEIRDYIIPQFEELGFTVDTQTEKNKCNCIIRVFKKIDYDYESVFISLYGATCFLPRAGQWVSHDLNGKEFKIDHDNCIWRSWIFQDEYIDFECEFEDFYVKVSRK